MHFLLVHNSKAGIGKRAALAKLHEELIDMENGVYSFRLNVVYQNDLRREL